MPKIRRFNAGDIRSLTTSPLYKGYFEMVQYQFQHRLFNGGWSDTVTREIFERGHAVGLLPYDPITEEFVLIEQVRIGALPTCESPWLIEIIAGIIEEGEHAEEVCRREAMEEAGIKVTHVQEVQSYLASPGGTTERMRIFIAKVDSHCAAGVHGLAHESEDILVHRVSEENAKKWLADGTIDNAAALIALQWFFLNKQTLLNGWQHCDQ